VHPPDLSSRGIFELRLPIKRIALEEARPPVNGTVDMGAVYSTLTAMATQPACFDSPNNPIRELISWKRALTHYG
jgi:hypothetical protein